MTSPQKQSTDDATAWTTQVGTIRKGMKVIGPEGEVLGVVAGLEGEELLLAEHQGEHRPFVALTQIDGVSDDAVLLQARGDATFGLGAEP